MVLARIYAALLAYQATQNGVYDSKLTSPTAHAAYVQLWPQKLGSNNIYVNPW